MDVAVLSVVLFCFAALVFCQSSPTVTLNKCIGAETCGGCIGTAPDCAWCADEGFDRDNRERCDTMGNLVAAQCSAANIFSPVNKLTKISDENVRDGVGESDAIQIQPQNIKINIRPNTPEKFTLTFRLAENYPVDLYYLMDLSNSMEDDKKNLAKLGTKIAESMSEITKNFRLGFGSFVDKVVMPYVSTVPSKLVSPCTNCEAPYSFKNQLALDKNTSLFEEKVLAANISGNLDAPEGGFDAIMQAIMCGQIGWRNVSRKLLLFSTDAGFHFAGDGKLGGIVLPNDGECHLNPAGKYTEAENQDYPSIHQIAAKVRHKSINVIFAVTGDQVPVYSRLTEYIEGSEAAELADDSSDIVTVIRNNYNRITSKLELNTLNAENVTVKFRSKCKTDGELKETSVCEGLSIGDTVIFEVEVMTKSCPAEKNKQTRMFSIYPVGLNERLNITLDLICECDCELPANEDRDSDLCNRQGTHECGQCTCNPGRYGKACECDASQITSEESLKECTPKNVSNPVACSGRGECICGVCHCDTRHANTEQKYGGKYCECDGYSCSYHNNKLCGGNGLCDCGECKCFPGYTGDACECPTSTEVCKTTDGKICNGVGECVCGRCKCNETLSYTGPTCEECPTCPGKCAENNDCALCKAFSTGKLGTDECEKQCQHVTAVPSIDTDAAENSPDLHLCQFKDSDDCVYFFTYEYGDNNAVIVQVQQEKECPKSVNVRAIVLGTIGGIVFLGLIALFIWKIVTTIKDRREYAKFIEETENPKWDTGHNPMYKPATSTYKNPTYGAAQ